MNSKFHLDVLNETAVNYNPVVTIDDGSCELPIYGCTDPNG